MMYHSMYRPTTFLTLAVLAVGLVAVAGCRSARTPMGARSTPVAVEISGSSDLNGGGNAAFVHVFQLTDNAGLRSAQAESFWQSPDQSLGDAVRASNQVQLFPGETERLDLELPPDVRFVGVAANLRDPDRDRWRTVLPVSEMSGGVLRVLVDSNSLSVQGTE